MLRITTEYTGTLQGVPYYSTLYWGGSTSGEADAAAAALQVFVDGLSDNFSTKLTYNIPGEAEIVDPLTGNVTGVETINGASSVGAQAGDELPPFTQGLIRWRTGQFVNGREIRGRMFVPGPVEVQSVTGVPTAGYVTALSDLASDFLGGSSAAGGLVVYSPTHREQAAVQTATVWNRWATLRSRRD